MITALHLAGMRRAIEIDGKPTTDISYLRLETGRPGQTPNPELKLTRFMDEEIVVKGLLFPNVGLPPQPVPIELHKPKDSSSGFIILSGEPIFGVWFVIEVDSESYTKVIIEYHTGDRVQHIEGLLEEEEQLQD